MRALRPYLIFALLSLILLTWQEYSKIGLNYYIQTAEGIPGFFQMDLAQKATEMEAFRQPSLEYSTAHLRFPMLHELSLGTLVKLKWGWAISLIGFHFLLGFILLRATKQNELVKRLFLIYVLGVGVSGIVMLSGALVGVGDVVYPLARRILGGMQSPIPLVILLLLHKLMNQSK